jgi:alpha-beta hydrolase superfamily lysophospholipase
MIPIITDAGLTSLVITYRNDEGVPRSESGYHDYGLTEWYDLEAAVQYALDNGASDIVLVGYGMGGGITANFLYQSDLADEVIGVILDSPMLDFRDVIDFGGERRGLPSLLTGVGELVAGFRFGIDWDATDYTNRFDQLDGPILLFHGDIDRTVHKRTSDQLAAQLEDIVTYVDPPGAGHVRAWNVDSARYEQAVATFIEDLR